MKGKIKWYDSVKGYGFIITDNGDVFVHYSNIDNNIQELINGEIVSFEVEQGLKGPYAVSVKSE